MNKKKKNDNVENIKFYIKKLTFKLFVVVIIFLSLAIICKSNNIYKNKIYANIYEKNINFTKIKKIYNKYLGGIIPFDNIVSDIEPVFNEKLKYTDTSKYLNGVKLEVDDNYLIPILEDGMVTFIGEKEGYGNVVIIEGMNGINIWYGNINQVSIKLYDYVEKGNLLGDVKENYLYLVYSKNGEYLNYEEYL